MRWVYTRCQQSTSFTGSLFVFTTVYTYATDFRAKRTLNWKYCITILQYLVVCIFLTRFFFQFIFTQIYCLSNDDYRCVNIRLFEKKKKTVNFFDVYICIVDGNKKRVVLAPSNFVSENSIAQTSYTSAINMRIVVCVCVAYTITIARAMYLPHHNLFSGVLRKNAT